MGVIMGTPVLQNLVTPSPYARMDTICTQVCTGREDVSSLEQSGLVRLRSRSCSHPFPKLGSGLLHVFCSFSINIKSNYLDFFFIAGEVIRILFLYSIEKNTFFLLSELTITTQQFKPALGSTHMKAIARAKAQSAGKQAAGSAETLLTTQRTAGHVSRYTAHS